MRTQRACVSSHLAVLKAKEPVEATQLLLEVVLCVLSCTHCVRQSALIGAACDASNSADAAGNRRWSMTRWADALHQRWMSAVWSTFVAPWRSHLVQRVFAWPTLPRRGPGQRWWAARKSRGCFWKGITAVISGGSQTDVVISMDLTKRLITMAAQREAYTDHVLTRLERETTQCPSIGRTQETRRVHHVCGATGLDCTKLWTAASGRGQLRQTPKRRGGAVPSNARAAVSGLSAAQSMLAVLLRTRTCSHSLDLSRFRCGVSPRWWGKRW